MQAEELKKIIEQGIPASQVTVQGEGDHFEATIVSDAFVGKSMVQQHQMVYAALGDLLQGGVHALSFRTYTTQEWDKQIQ